MATRTRKPVKPQPNPIAQQIMKFEKSMQQYNDDALAGILIGSSIPLEQLEKPLTRPQMIRLLMIHEFGRPTVEAYDQQMVARYRQILGDRAEPMIDAYYKNVGEERPNLDHAAL